MEKYFETDPKYMLELSVKTRQFARLIILVTKEQQDGNSSSKRKR
jgi:hypothetical protein